MSKIPGGVDRSALHVAARGVLLDALDALGPHTGAVVVVGAQAIYLRSQDADLTVAAFTADGDLSVDPSLLSDEPRLEAAMNAGGFVLRAPAPGRVDPGVWVRTVMVSGTPAEVSVDLLVATSLAPTARRRHGARIPPHSSKASKKVAGLEATLVDNSVIRIIALDPADSRAAEVRVAGPAALMISKAHKLADRLADRTRPDRVVDKDAADVLRLMRSSPAQDVAETMQMLVSHEIAGAATREGLAQLEAQFGGRAAPGVEMAVSALAGGAVDEEQIRRLAPAYIGFLVAAAGIRPADR